MTEQDRIDLASRIKRKKEEWARKDTERGETAFISPVATSGVSKPPEGQPLPVSVPSEREHGLQATVDVSQEPYSATDEDLPENLF